MINQTLKEVIENLSDTVNACGMSKTISDHKIFEEACKFLRTPGLVGKTPEVKGTKKPSGKKGKPASEAQIKYYHKYGLGDTEKLTAAEAFEVIKKHKEEECQ